MIINNVTHKIRFEPLGRSLNVTVLIILVAGQEYMASNYIAKGYAPLFKTKYPNILEKVDAVNIAFPLCNFHYAYISLYHVH